MMPMTHVAAVRGRDRMIGMATFAGSDAVALTSAFVDVPGVLGAGVVRVEGRPALRVEFDPTFVSYEQLVEIFVDDARLPGPAALRQEGAAVLVHSAEQEALANALLRRLHGLSRVGTPPVVRVGRRVGSLDI
jgi:hypothetical protein